MDILTIILRTVREAIQATGAPPDPLQAALEDAERRLRSSVGGAMHHISRAPQITTKVRVVQLAESGLAASQISERLGISDRHVRRVLQTLRQTEQ